MSETKKKFIRVANEEDRLVEATFPGKAVWNGVGSALSKGRNLIPDLIDSKFLKFTRPDAKSGLEALTRTDPNDLEAHVLNRIYKNPNELTGVQQQGLRSLKPGVPGGPLNTTGAYQKLVADRASPKSWYAKVFTSLNTINQPVMNDILNAKVQGLQRWGKVPGPSGGGPPQDVQLSYSCTFAQLIKSGELGTTVTVDPAKMTAFQASVDGVANQVASRLKGEDRAATWAKGLKSVLLTAAAVPALAGGHALMDAHHNIHAPDASTITQILGAPGSEFNTDPTQNNPADAYTNPPNAGTAPGAAPGANAAGPAQAPAMGGYNNGMTLGPQVNPYGPLPTNVTDYAASMRGSALDSGSVRLAQSLSPPPDIDQLLAQAVSICNTNGGASNPEASQKVLQLLQAAIPKAQHFSAQMAELSSSQTSAPAIAAPATAAPATAAAGGQ